MLAATWVLCLLQVLTPTPDRTFEFLRPWTREQGVVAAAFLLTSVALLEPPRPWLASLHLSVVGFLFILHPSSAVFGRDGALAAIAVHGLVFLWLRTPYRPEAKLLATSLVLGSFVVETSLSIADSRAGRPRAGLLDFAELLGSCGEGGCLEPGLDVRIVAEGGGGRFVTNRAGFRNAVEVGYEKAAGTRRILLIGDSFVAGYRMDQERMVGRVLERMLRQGAGAGLDVLVAELPHPEASAHYLRTHAARFHPDLVIVGITLGNDIAQSWAVRRRVPEPVVACLRLPPDAFRHSAAAGALIGIERSLRAWRAYRRLLGWLRQDPIVSDYSDGPHEVHLFDAMHGLGLFYARQRLALVEQAYDESALVLEELQAAAASAGIPLVVALFPQRFQVSRVEWRTTAFEYGLDSGAFDVDQPNRRISEACRRVGLECVDVLPAFRAEPGQTYLPRGDMHWNARGHATAARALAPAVLGRLPAAAPSPVPGEERRAQSDSGLTGRLRGPAAGPARPHP